MLNIKKEGANQIMLELNGKLDSKEMEQGLDQLIEVTKGMQDGKMLYIIENFEMPTIGAIMIEFSKLPALFTMISRIEKIAVLADEAWLRTIAEWEGAILPNLKIKTFTKHDEKEARTWLTS